MFRWLSEHQEICASQTKETYFFADQELDYLKIRPNHRQDKVSDYLSLFERVGRFTRKKWRAALTICTANQRCNSYQVSRLFRESLFNSEIPRSEYGRISITSSSAQTARYGHRSQITSTSCLVRARSRRGDSRMSPGLNICSRINFRTVTTYSTSAHGWPGFHAAMSRS